MALKCHKDSYNTELETRKLSMKQLELTDRQTDRETHNYRNNNIVARLLIDIEGSRSPADCQGHNWSWTETNIRTTCM